MTDMMEAQVETHGAPSSTAVVQARDALATGRPALARDVLVDHVSTTYDREALALLGEVLYDLQDLPGAGAAWFGTNCRGAQVDEAIAAWRAAHHDDFGALWRSLPKPVRVGPRSAKVEALRLKAFPGAAPRKDPLAGGAHSGSGRMPRSGPAQSSGAPGESSAVGEMSAAVEPSAAAAPSVSAQSPSKEPLGDRADVPSQTRVQDNEGMASLTQAPAQDAVDPWSRRRSPSSAGAERRREADRGADPARRARASHRASEDAASVDPSRIIAWVLAAIFICCAVVGAVTIIGWLIPG